MRPERPWFFAALALLGAGCRDTPRDAASTASPIPAALQVPAGQRLLSTALARGAQVYACSRGAAGAFGWTLKAPDAELLDPQGKVIGKHYGGPTWESTDGSMVVGDLVATVDAPVPGAIPWLLLRARSNHGDGAFGKVKSVQRVDTRGGVAPAPPGCDAAHADAQARVDYQATYRFYVAP